MSTSEQSASRLVAVAELGDSQVAVVEETPHGTLAVGMSAGKPFAVSNRCRHLFASLGEGQVTGDGCLEKSSLLPPLVHKRRCTDRNVGATTAECYFSSALIVIVTTLTREIRRDHHHSNPLPMIISAMHSPAQIPTTPCWRVNAK